MPGFAARLLALQHQLEASQWWSPEELETHQFRQLELLFAHAEEHVPFYAERLGAVGFRRGRPLTPEIWARLPILSRRDIQENGAALTSRFLPEGHGETASDSTSGSSGMPIKVVKSALSQLFWNAIALREQLWQRRDFSAKHAVIRRDGNNRSFAPDGSRFANWGAPVSVIFETGPSALLDVRSSVAEQAAWLMREDPDYLLGFPSNLAYLARHMQAKGLRPRRLRDLRTFGEVVSPELRRAVAEIWGVRVTDVYSTAELGYLALQCPDNDHYHVQSESVRLEVLDTAGAPCRPGEVGRVVATGLHNFAMPLLRYELGDHAEVGPPCSCGRGLPVIRRILGRTKDVVRLPNGETRWAYHGPKAFTEVPAIIQYQIVQKTLSDLEIKIVARRPLDAAETEKVRAAVLGGLGYPFNLAITYHDEIPRSPSGKFFDFRSELPAEDPAAMAGASS